MSAAGTSRPGSRSSGRASQLVLRDLLAELAERVDVRVLAWAGAPLPLFRPSRGDVRRMRDRLVGTDSGSSVALDATSVRSTATTRRRS